jgi:tRNA(Ile)-lysidine synthetase-like protein
MLFAVTSPYHYNPNMDFLAASRRFIAKHDLFPRGTTIVVGVSGGPDSLCLLHALKTLAPEYDLRLHVAHLDHQLRGDAAQADADFVQDVAQGWNLPYTIEARDVKAFAHAHKLSIEEAARQMRYAFLIEVAVANDSETIAVAHNADDQAESVLMHFLRGSGLSGLRGMLPKMRISEFRIRNGDSAFRLPHSALNNLYLVRPLLEIPRAAIDDYCVQHDLRPRIDATNADTTYFRNRLRHELLPTLATYNPNIRSILRRTASVIAAEHELLEAHRNFAWDMTIVAESGTAITFSLSLWREQPLATQRALLRRAIHQLRPPLRDIDFVHIEDAVELLGRAATGDQVTLPQNLFLEVSYDTFTLAPRDQLSLPDWPLLPEGVTSIPIAVPGTTSLPESSWVLSAQVIAADDAPPFLTAGLSSSESNFDRWIAYLDADTLSAPLAMRVRLSADDFHPHGMASPVRLKDWLIGVKVPRAIRDRLPLIVSGDQIVWVSGVRLGQPFIVTAKTSRIVKLIFRKV